jgi:hypothetical protein
MDEASLNTTRIIVQGLQLTVFDFVYRPDRGDPGRATLAFSVQDAGAVVELAQLEGVSVVEFVFGGHRYAGALELVRFTFERGRGRYEFGGPAWKEKAWE